MKLGALFAGCLFAAAVSLPAAADVSIYTAQLDGSSEAPPNPSPGTGVATVTIDSEARTMRVQESFSELMEGVTVSHIHCCTESPNTGTEIPATMVPTFTDFPSGVVAGMYDHTFDMRNASSYNPDFITAHGNTVNGAFDALVAGLDSGSAYANIHTSAFMGGEIRGFLTLVPEPETYAMLLAGLGLISLMARRRV